MFNAREFTLIDLAKNTVSCFLYDCENKETSCGLSFYVAAGGNHRL